MWSTNPASPSYYVGKVRQEKYEAAMLKLKENTKRPEAEEAEEAAEVEIEEGYVDVPRFPKSDGKALTEGQEDKG